MGVQASWGYAVKSEPVMKALETVILSLLLKINPWLPAECQFVCRHTVLWVTGQLGNLSSFPEVFEFTATMLMIEVNKNHRSESTRATEPDVVPIVPWALWPLLSGWLFRTQSSCSVYKNRREKAKCLHIYNLQCVISCTRESGRWLLLSSWKEEVACSSLKRWGPDQCGFSETEKHKRRLCSEVASVQSRRIT